MNTKKLLNSFNAGFKLPVTALGLMTALLLIISTGFAQEPADKITAAMKELHQALVKKDSITIGRLTHFNLSYGHSNGLLETKSEILRNNISHYLDYNSFKEDSIHIVITGNVAYARFNADINSSRGGNPPVAIHLKVLEVWIMEKKQWLLLARQAVR